MAPTMWSMCGSSSDMDVNVVYEGFPQYFTMRVHHGGLFSRSPGRRYVFGKLNYVDFIDIDEFSIHEMDVIYEELGYDRRDRVYYLFRIPGLDLDCGLLPLGNDQDVIRLSSYVPNNKEIHVYIEHGATQQLRVIFAGNEKYQVTGLFNDQKVVNMRENVCSCIKWELSGMPCKHAVAVIWDMIQNGQGVEKVEFWVHECYRLSTWKDMYKVKVDPINGKDMWPKSTCPTKLTPPNHHKQVGRPKKKRVRGVSEVSSQASQNLSQATKLTRKFLSVTCSKRHNKGHNARTCKGQGGQGEGSKKAGRARSKTKGKDAAV